MNPGRWTAPRGLALVAIALAWLAAGLGVYLSLGAHRSTAATTASQPGQVQTREGPLQRLPGTLYLVQDGTLYRLQQGNFTALLRANGNTTWTMPAVSPNGQSLVVVQRNYAYSDLYLVDTAGHVRQQLTLDASKTVELNHWALYPKLGADGSTLWFDYDPKDYYNDYNVVMAVWSIPLGGRPSQMRKWTTPNDYTGGDVQPVPLASGGVIYTKYALQTNVNKILGQVWLSKRAGSAGTALTPAADDCSQPALSPDGTRLAMICTGGTQIANIEVATFDGTSLGPRQVVVSGQLAAQPTWSPDGLSIVYLAAQGISGHFQLWQQQLPLPPPSPSALPSPIPSTRLAASPRTARIGSPTPAPTATRTTPSPTPSPLPAPVQLTSNLDFDATSTIAWHV